MWYEVFVDYGEERGTETVFSTESLEKAKEIRQETINQFDYDPQVVHIDQWDCQNDPEVIAEII